MDLTTHLLLLAGLLVAAAFFAGTETALSALTRGQRERLSRSEHAADRYIGTLLRDPTRLTVTILLASELVAISFASVSTGLLARVAGGMSETVMILATTGLAVPILLLLGEIAPRALALRVAEPWARVTARPLGLFALCSAPVRWVVGGLTRVLVPPRAGQGPVGDTGSSISEAEFRALVDAGSADGELDASERRLIHNVFRFGDRSVGEIMTQAKDVFSLSYELPLARVVTEVAACGFSRIPVHRGRKVEIVGILFAKDLVGWGGGRLAQRTLKDLIKAPLYVPKGTRCANVFQEFRRRKTHMALVVDEYGRLVGLVTMEDLLRELLGRPHDAEPPRETAGGPGAPRPEVVA